MIIKKRFAFILSLVFLICMTAACTGTPVVYGGDCPQAADTVQPADAVKTGLSLTASLDAKEGDRGAACAVQLIAVNVDDSGRILSCVTDGMSAEIGFDSSGTDILPDSEQSPSQGDWPSLAEQVQGKTVQQLRQNDTACPEAVLAAIENAVANATYLGARRGDELRLAALASVDGTNAAGSASLNCEAVALTLRDGIITACIFDGLQAEAEFDTEGRIISDLDKAVHSKNVLGEAYGMKAYGGARLEWRDQAASFAAYLRGKSAEQVAGVAVMDGRAADADIASMVTISVGGFLRLAERAMAA